ncbi:MAG: ParB/RepB/Spo0J family partition protein [Cyanobacteria bacterium P01_A01_bin.17]
MFTESTSDSSASVNAITAPPLWQCAPEKKPILKGNNGEFRQLDIDQIVELPWLPRQFSNLQNLENLAASIRQKGIVVPILVRPASTRSSLEIYELIAGRQRVKAAKKIGLKSIPALIRPLSDVEAKRHAVMDNILRQSLGMLEETEAIVHLVAATLKISENEAVPLLHKIGKRYRELGHNVMPNEWKTVLDLFSALGKNIGSFRSNELPMLNWPEDVKRAVRSQKIATSKGRIIARMTDDQQREEVLNRAIEEGATVDQIKRLRREQEGDADAELCSKDLKTKAENTWAQLKKSDVWNCAERKEKLAGLLRQMNQLIQGTDTAA